ncbi:DNA polymerase III subunit delta [Candidatus Deianiraea vastatrix]|uniref:DNA-directed DNA polymerase n=1 Tax=Candidatus Deianiraea vastatrix TaxID=2163644 RepID=A0A5B8XF86_9RICK|nr:DNA polymerase III subunit delta [Candidatus Deianiraea vastatrix]QED23930.1 DNA polymerase III subunit delta [Candidatus Deianiraea vastatrix]
MAGKLNVKLANEFAKNPDINMNSTLIYGNDDAVMLYFSDALKLGYKNLGFQVKTLNFETKNIANAISDELNSVDFFAEKKVLIISDIKDKDFEKLETQIDRLDGDKIIFLVSDIAKNPQIRDFHEKSSKKAVSIACYPLERQDCINQISKILNENDIVPEDRAIIENLADLIGNNPFDIRNEMEKISILCSKTKTLKYTDIESIINTNDDSLFNLIDAFFLKRIGNISKYAMECEENGVNSVIIARSLYKHACKILNAIFNIKGGSSREIEAKNAGIFFKKTAVFYSQIDTWNPKDLERIIVKLVFLDKNLRMASDKSAMPEILNLLRR